MHEKLRPLSAAVVIAAFNRPDSLLKLLRQLSTSITEKKFDLIVSVDKGPDQTKISRIVDAVDWNLGQKRVISHPTNLGLKAHILKCGDMVDDYDMIILLEEDLIVSQYALEFAHECASFYFDDPLIAGISLYSYRRKESNNMPFFPVNDGSDIYFMQFASSWGQAWTRGQWTQFRDWLTKNDCDNYHDALVPNYISNWPRTSWKKHFIRYMIRSNKYFVFPFLGLSTNPGTNGQHHNQIFDLFNSPVLHGGRNWLYPAFSKSKTIYDSNFSPCANSNVVLTGDFIEGKYLLDTDLASVFFKLNPFRSNFYIMVLGWALFNDLNILMQKIKRRLTKIFRSFFRT